MTRMDLATIEANVENLDTSQGFDLIYDLLEAYGMPKATIARLRKGSTNLAKGDGERLLRNKVYYRFLNEWESDRDVHAVIDDAAADEVIAKAKPRFLIVRDKEQLVAMDRSTGETLDVPLEKLHLHASFFLPWAGIEKTQVETAHFADIKAAEKMARLYDEIRKVNEIETDEERHALNVFFSRLLFCFFAEDTGIFEAGQVTTAIGSLTREDGDDLDSFLDQLFTVLDTPLRDRGELPSYLESFGYVNGSLFSERTAVPQFSAKARKIILECAELDWSEINPDIFGSMMQAVVHPEERAGLGMHYTSVENIMKVLRPLFLDELNEELAAAEDDPRKLRKLHDRISKVKVFDPACGSGNFLVIAYKELRALEHEVLERLRELEADPKGAGLFEVSRVSLDNFIGIEIDDFASGIARLSLWLTKHQIDKRFEELFGSHLHTIPLREAGHIVTANATRLEWTHVCRRVADEDILVCGNPPYVGSSMQTREQKSDLANYFGEENFSPNLDYISLWLLKGADYARETGATVGLVSTNSVAQGDHVALLFPKLFDRGVGIQFAHQSFPWSNSARGSATVSCVVIGLRQKANLRHKKRLLYSGERVREVDHIGPYLIPMKRDVVVSRARKPVSAFLPSMVRGSQPTDGGHLNMTRAERDEVVETYPRAAQFIRQYMGAEDFVHGRERYCIWVEDDDASAAKAIPPLAERFELVAEMRSRGSAPARAMADRPYRFVQPMHQQGRSIIVPRHTSSRRDYLPIGFLDDRVVISDAANAVYGAEVWLLGILSSRMHMAWLRTVGGALGTGLRYSVLVYNSFVVPQLSPEVVSDLTEGVLLILAAREQFPNRNLAELYDPERMPISLRKAHEMVDGVIDRAYCPAGFTSDDERLELLFELYEEMTSKERLGA